MIKLKNLKVNTKKRIHCLELIPRFFLRLKSVFVVSGGVFRTYMNTGTHKHTHIYTPFISAGTNAKPKQSLRLPKPFKTELTRAATATTFHKELRANEREVNIWRPGCVHFFCLTLIFQVRICQG